MCFTVNEQSRMHFIQKIYKLSWMKEILDMSPKQDQRFVKLCSEVLEFIVLTKREEIVYDFNKLYFVDIGTVDIILPFNYDNYDKGIKLEKNIRKGSFLGENNILY